MEHTQHGVHCQHLSTLLDYADGNIILLSPQGKIPLEDNWTTKDSKINGDARTYLALGYNLGYRIPSDVLVIDVDPRNGGNDSFATLPIDVQALPVTTRTPSGGFHIYTKLPPDIVPRQLRTATKEYPGIDFLHTGRQVVLPGSSLSLSSGWTLDQQHVFPPPPTPRSLINILIKPDATHTDNNLTGAAYLSPGELHKILSDIPVSSYRSNEAWLRLTMACHHATDGHGKQVFIDWSISDPLYSDQYHIIERRWDSMDSANTEAPITIRTLIKELARVSTVPQWLSIRAGLRQPPEQYFKDVEQNKNAAEQVYNNYIREIEDTDSNITLTTTTLARIVTDSVLPESAKEILINLISKKACVSKSAIGRDVKALKSPPPETAQSDATNQATDISSATDTGQEHTAAAKRAIYILSHDSGAPVAYCFATWFLWHDNHWKQDDVVDNVEKAAMTALYEQGTTITSSAVGSVVKLMQVLSAKPTDYFTPPEKTITIPADNTILRLQKGEWVPSDHTPSNRNKCVITPSYDPTAPTPDKWLKFLSEVTTSEQARRSIACYLIYSAAGSKPWLRKCLYIYGPKRSGKSTLLDTISYILNDDNCSALSMKQLGRRFGLSSLFDKLANISNETLSKDILKDDIFKALVSGEALSVEKKYIDAQLIMKNTTKLWFAANSFPRITDESDATMDRITIISCPRTFKKHERDNLLYMKLQKEVDGILLWALNIFAEEYQKDLCMSAMEMDTAAQGIMDKWERTNNPALAWYRERTKAVIGHDLKVSTAYADYRTWCRDNGHKEASATTFSRQLSKVVSRKKSTGVQHFVSLELLPYESELMGVLK